MSFDIGAPAIDRATYSGSGYTFITKENPASQDGLIEHVAIYAQIAGLGLKVAIFTQVAPNTFTTRSHYTIGAFPIGYSEHDVLLHCHEGDFIGCYYSSGNIDRDDVGDLRWSLKSDEIPCTDKLFGFTLARTLSLWGWYTSPPVHYDRFTVTDIEYSQNCKEITAIIQTNVGCHLWLRLTKNPPRKHPRTSNERGLLIAYNVYTCYTVYGDVEQQEAGDTSEHTFILPGLEFCQRYYFYLWGESADEIMVYTTAIMWIDYPLGEPPFLTCQVQELAVTNTGFLQYWNAFSQTFTVDHDYKVDHLSLMVNQFSTESRGPYCVKITRNIPPCWTEPLIAIDYGSSAGLPAPGSKAWKSWWGITPVLEVGKSYRIVVHTLPGWQSWNGEEWVENESAAALRWWISDGSDPYPNGAAYHGCNFREQEGAWEIHATYDATFRLWQRCPSLPS